MHTKVAQQMETTDVSGVKYHVTGHPHPMELYAVKKDGENKGKHFFTCSICKGLGNKIFNWAEDVAVTGSTSKPTFNKTDANPKKNGIPFTPVVKPDAKSKKRPAPPTPPAADDDDEDDDDDEEEDTEVSDWDAIREMAAELRSQASELEKFARKAALKAMDK